MTTELIYLTDMSALTADAVVQEVIKDQPDRTCIILDRTVFYPQGGGQPYDQGKIIAPNSLFQVDEVRFSEGIVRHFGRFVSGLIAPGENVSCQVDAARRLLMSRLHSAGHVVDMSIHQLCLDWTPGKGYHFPDGPYVEYQGDLPENVEQLRLSIETKSNSIIAQGLTTRIEFMPKEAMHAVCRYIPDHLPEGKPARVVFYVQFGVPCGGTHLANLSAIGQLTVRKIKPEKGNIRLSYAIE